MLSMNALDVNVKSKELLSTLLNTRVWLDRVAFKSLMLVTYYQLQIEHKSRLAFGYLNQVQHFLQIKYSIFCKGLYNY